MKATQSLALSSLLSDRRSGAAFSLIEVLIVIAIVSLLAAIALPTLGHARASAQATRCLSNLREIGMLTRLYCEDHDGRLPKINADPFPVLLWGYAYGGEITMSSSPGLPAALSGTVFECPAALKEAASSASSVRSYGMNTSLVPAYSDRGSGIPLTLVQLPSRAALYADVKNSSTLKQPTCNPRHSGNMNVLFVDGHAAQVQPTSPDAANGASSFWTGVPK